MQNDKLVGIQFVCLSKLLVNRLCKSRILLSIIALEHLYCISARPRVFTEREDLCSVLKRYLVSGANGNNMSMGAYGDDKSGGAKRDKTSVPGAMIGN